MANLRKDRQEAIPAPSTEGRLVYAIGDIHGRLDLFEALIRSILADALESRPQERPILVLLGDYLDRGPQSAGVLDLVTQLQGHSALELHALKGNHEDALLTFLDDPSFGATWIRFGGDATLQSYGVTAPERNADAAIWRAVRDTFALMLPGAHLDLLKSLELMLCVGDYAFVHAGVRPRTPLLQQSEEDLLWIRADFLEWTGRFDKIIVHGHSPSAEVQISPYRLGIDTGAYATGVLTALRLLDASRSLIQTEAPRP